MLLRLLAVLPALLFGSMMSVFGQAVQSYEVVVLGQNSQGAQAASAAARLGRKTVLIGYPAADFLEGQPGVMRLHREEFRLGTEGALVFEGLSLRQIRTVTASGEVNAIEGRVFIDCTEDKRLLAALGLASRDTSETFIPIVIGGEHGHIQPAPYEALVADSVDNVIGMEEASKEYSLFGEWDKVAGVAAAISLKQQVPVPQVDIRQIQAQLLEDSVTIFQLEDMPRNGGKAWAGAQLIALHNGFTYHRFGPDSVMPPRRFEAWWPAIFPTRGMPGPIYQPASRRDAAETVWQFFRATYLNPKPKPAQKRGKK